MIVYLYIHIYISLYDTVSGEYNITQEYFKSGTLSTEDKWVK